MVPTAPVPATYRITFEDWLRYPDDGNRYEILEGELYVSPAPSIRHQLILTELLHQLRSHLGLSRGKVVGAPAGVRLADDIVVEPDLVVVLADHLDRIAPAAIVGAPDLVVEILSPGTAGRDIGTKRVLYERADVPEYWIVDPIAETAQVLSLRGGGYQEVGLYRRDQTLLSPLLPGLQIQLSEVF